MPWWTCCLRQDNLFLDKPGSLLGWFEELVRFPRSVVQHFPFGSFWRKRAVVRTQTDVRLGFTSKVMWEAQCHSSFSPDLPADTGKVTVPGYLGIVLGSGAPALRDKPALTCPERIVVPHSTVLIALRTVPSPPLSPQPFSFTFPSSGRDLGAPWDSVIPC